MKLFDEICFGFHHCNDVVSASFDFSERCILGAVFDDLMLDLGSNVDGVHYSFVVFN